MERVLYCQYNVAVDIVLHSRTLLTSEEILSGLESDVLPIMFSLPDIDINVTDIT